MLYLSLGMSDVRRFFEKAGCHALNILHELGYPQTKTKMYSGNLVAKGIANDEITIRKSKAFHTRYPWIRDRVSQGQYQIVYLPGAKLLADFFTKPQPPIKHKLKLLYQHLKYISNNKWP